MKNDYEVRGEVTAIIIDSRKYGRLEALISTKNLDRVKEMTGSWNLLWSRLGKTFYVVGFMLDVKTTRYYLHRWVTNAPMSMVVDHSNNDTLNNTDYNLRIITQAANMQNRKGAQVNNTSSGIRGVTFDKSRGQWMAKIKANGKHIYLGRFSGVEEAEKVVKEARSRYMPFSKEALAK